MGASDADAKAVSPRSHVDDEAITNNFVHYSAVCLVDLCRGDDLDIRRDVAGWAEVNYFLRFGGASHERARDCPSSQCQFQTANVLPRRQSTSIHQRSSGLSN